MAKVQGYTPDEVDALVVDFQTVIMRSITTALAKVADGLPSAVVASSLSADDAHAVTHAWEEEVDGVLTPYIAQVYTGSATSIALGTATAFPNHELPGVPVLPDDFALTYMKSRVNSLYNVSDELWEDVRNELIDGIQNGSSTKQVAEKIKLLGQFNQNEAERIARTEMHSAIESGNHAQMIFMGFTDDEVQKVWEYTHDNRVRRTHSEAGGQSKPLTVPFEVGGSHLMFPGAPGGAPDEIIHCRCTVIYDFDTPPKHRCGGVVITASAQVTAAEYAMTAATTPTGSSCAIPMHPADLSSFTSSTISKVSNAFLAKKISPAYGGAKIHKVVQEVRAEISAEGSSGTDLMNLISDRQIVAMVDKNYVAKGATFSQKYDEWLQSPAGLKATGGATHPVIGFTTPISVPAPATIAPTIPALPPIPGQPSPANLFFTGKKFSSASGAEVWQDSVTGDKWLFKPVSASGSYTNKFLLKIEPALARLQSKALLSRPAVYEIDLNGKQGTVQFMFKSTEAFPHGSFNPATLSADDLLVMQREQIFDWMVSNHDTHSGQWIRLENGELFGIDKGQAFKFFPNDKLDWNYVPVTPLGQDKLTYSRMWKDYVSGKNIGLQDPTQGALGEYIDRLMAIPDAEYRKLLQPYVNARVAQFGGDATKTLDQMVARKNNLRKDFEEFWARAQVERAKNLPSVPSVTTVPKPVVTTPIPPPPPAPTVPVVPTTAVGSGDLGDISAFSDYFLKSDIDQAWYTAGGDKTVTPAWGGAKLWKVLQATKTKTDASFAHVGMAGQGPNEWQILKIMDDFKGYDGKPKTYESVLTDWLNSPAGKKAVPNPPPALKAMLGKGAPVPPVGPPPMTVTPITAIKLAGKTPADEVKEAVLLGDQKTNSEIFLNLTKYNDGDTVALGKGGSVQYKIEKVNSTTVQIYTQTDMAGPDWVPFVTTSKKSDLGGVQWYGVDSTKGKLAPSKIVGKGPGDIVHGDELEASKWVWHKDDVMATTTTSVGYDYKLVSNGDGTAKIFSKTMGAPDTSYQVVHDDALPFLQLSPIGKNDWKLTSDVLLPTTKKSTMVGVNAGDPMTAAEVMAQSIADSNGPSTLAYGWDGVHVYKVGDLNGQKTLFIKAPNETYWQYLDDVNTEAELKANTGAFFGSTGKSVDKWYAAVSDGSPPDVFKAKLPGGAVSPGAKPASVPKTYSHKSGVFVDDPISEHEIMSSVYDSPTPGAVIATGTSSNGTNWKVVYDTDDILHAKFIDPDGNLVDAGVINDATEIPTVVGGWKASADTVPAMTLKASKPLSNIPGKKVGEVVTQSEMWPTVSGMTSETPVAYTYDPVHGDVWKIVQNQSTGYAEVYAKGGGYSPAVWSKIGTAYSKDDFLNSGAYNSKTWYAAKTDGDPPDEMLDHMLATGNAHAKQAVKKFKPSAATPVKATKSTATIAPPPPGSPAAAQVHIPNVVDGQQIGQNHVWQNWQKYDDNQVIAYHVNAAGVQDKRAVKINGYLVQQTKSKAGTWVSLKHVEAQTHLDTGIWKASTDVLSPVDAAKTLKAFVTKTGINPFASIPTAPLKSPGVFIPGKSVGSELKGYDVGEAVTPAVKAKYPDGQLIAVKVKKSYSGTILGETHRLLKIDGEIVQQTKTKAGNWAGTKIIKNQYDVEYGTWVLKDEMLDAKESKKITTAVGKIKVKAATPKATPSYSSYSSLTTPTKPYVVPTVDTSGFSTTEQYEMQQHFKSQSPSTYSAQDVFSKLLNTKGYLEKKYGSGSKYDTMSDLQLLRMIDEQYAAQKGVPNTHKYEQLVMDWLQTADGKSFASRRIDAPILATDVPMPMHDFAAGPTFDSQTYPVMTQAQSLKNREDSHAKYGGWKPGEKSALRTYTGGSYTSWNAAIRRGVLGSYRDSIIKAQQGMRPSVRPMTLHRGTDFTEFNDPRITSAADLQGFIGRTYINRGFNSASFGGKAGFSGKQVILEIECPIGTPMSHAKDYSQVPSENEVTLATHLIYEILSVTKTSSYQTTVRVRVIGVGKP